MSKGSKPRPVDDDTYRRNYDKIFGTHKRNNNLVDVSEPEEDFTDDVYIGGPPESESKE